MRLRHDRAIVVFTLSLLVIGLGMVFSASARYGDGYVFLKRQLFNAAVGIVAMIVASRIDYRYWRKFALPALVGSGVFLLLLFLFEHRRGAQNWLPILGRTLQPVEFVRLALIFFLSARIVQLGPKLLSFGRGFLPMLAVIGVPVLLVLKQNDFGSAMVLSLVALSLLYAGGVRIRHLLGSASVLLLGGALFALYRPHVLLRLQAFLRPEEHASGIAYQSLQSVLYIGSGGLLGYGPGKGVAKFGYIPDPHTDFIFSVMGEELGFIGCCLVLVLFLLLVARTIRIAKQHEDPFAQLLAIGIGMSIFWYLVMNVLVATRLFPVTGLPLPFISYGGSALLSHLFALGVLRNLAAQAEPRRRLRRRWAGRSHLALEGAL